MIIEAKYQLQHVEIERHLILMPFYFNIHRKGK